MESGTNTQSFLDMDVREIKEIYNRIVIRIDKTDDELLFHLDDGSRWKMYHRQDCCEYVTLDDVCGDLNDLLDSPILKFEEVYQYSNKNDSNSFTWTFYKIATIKGQVDLKWYGTSNGYYSESVNIEQIKDPDPIEIQRSKKIKNLLK